MARNHHYLKIIPKYYRMVDEGIKKFELRNNDRDFKVYDIIHLQEFAWNNYTGRELSFEIKYILRGGVYGLDPDYCIINW